MCPRLDTGESYNFYFGIFICCGPLSCIYYIEGNAICDVTPCPLSE